MKAVSGIGEMIYVYFQDSTYSKNFPGTVFFLYYVFQTGVVKAATLEAHPLLPNSSQMIRNFQKLITQDESL